MSLKLKNPLSQIVTSVIALLTLSSCGLATHSVSVTSVSSTVISTTTTLPKVKITNFGATIANWNQAHTPDPNSPSNYWPRLSDGRDTYSNLIIEGGLVLGFTFAINPSIPSGAAETLAKNFMPSSESVVSSSTSSACHILNFSQLDGHKPFAALVFDGSGGVKSIIFGVDSYPSGC
ncbi:MAG: hypothetical protein M0019_04345 [Actinomycetota bacterium]|nr:hypothetical protein [Actinomycetota bacterium]